jgi:hypothetical protein
MYEEYGLETVKTWFLFVGSHDASPARFTSAVASPPPPAAAAATERVRQSSSVLPTSVVFSRPPLPLEDTSALASTHVIRAAFGFEQCTATSRAGSAVSRALPVTPKHASRLSRSPTRKYSAGGSAAAASLRPRGGAGAEAEAEAEAEAAVVAIKTRG